MKKWASTSGPTFSIGVCHDHHLQGALMPKRSTERTPPAAREVLRQARVAERLAARIRESDRLAQDWAATLDPRQREQLQPH